VARREYTEQQQKKAHTLYKEVGAGEAARHMKKMPVTDDHVLAATSWGYYGYAEEDKGCRRAGEADERAATRAELHEARCKPIV